MKSFCWKLSSLGIASLCLSSVSRYAVRHIIFSQITSVISITSSNNVSDLSAMLVLTAVAGNSPNCLLDSVVLVSILQWPFCRFIFPRSLLAATSLARYSTRWPDQTSPRNRSQLYIIGLPILLPSPRILMSNTTGTTSDASPPSIGYRHPQTNTASLSTVPPRHPLFLLPAKQWHLA